MVTREDNTYSFSAKTKNCKVSFDEKIRLTIDKKFIVFETIQEFILFSNKLIDVLEDYTEIKDENNNTL